MTEIEEVAAIIQNAAEMTPYWTDDPATHQDPYENAAKALLKSGYGKLVDEYEYAIQYFDDKDNTWYTIGEWFGYGPMDYWADKKNREEYIKELIEDYVDTQFILRHRRKAGKVETID